MVLAWGDTWLDSSFMESHCCIHMVLYDDWESNSNKEPANIPYIWSLLES